MRILLLFSLCLLALPAMAKPERYLYETQATTRAEPAEATEGMSLTAPSGYSVRGFMVSVCAAEGQTLDGDGHLRAWLYHPDAGLWMRNPDLDLPVLVAGARCQVWTDLRPGYLNSRRVLFAADGVLVTGTATVPEEQDTLITRIDADTTL